MADTPPGPGHEDGTITHVDGSLVLRFERMLRHPVDMVWTALTDPAECVHWLGALGHELVQDGPFELSTDGRKAATGTVTELVPPSGTGPAVVEYTWQATFADVGSAVIRWELTAIADHTHLVLTQTAAGADFLAEGAAGWHGLLDQLAELLAGDKVVADMDAWRARRTGYCASFGVPPNPAVP